MEKHLIAFDLDDTILTKLFNISDYTVEILARVQEEGHFIMPASARPLHLVDWVAEKIKPKAPVAMINGSYLYDFNKNIDVYPPILMSPEMVKKVWEYFGNEIGKEKMLNVQAENKEFFFSASEVCDERSLYIKEIKRVTEHAHVELDEAPPAVPASRMTIFPKAEYADMICEYLNRTYEDFICERVDWNGVAGDMRTRLYFRHKECDKWYAIQKAADYLGIKKENIITFGDQWNDVKMLSENKRGYALKGSYAASHASNITEFTCPEDGVAKELVKIFGLK